VCFSLLMLTLCLEFGPWNYHVSKETIKLIIVIIVVIAIPTRKKHKEQKIIGFSKLF
jgi:hypothetical protein